MTLDRLIIKADLSGNGLIADANESIIFVYDSKTHTLRRNTGGGNQPFGEKYRIVSGGVLSIKGENRRQIL